ncbi:MAG: DUF3313 family protein [Myxococcota bacterium]|nr:DUF3313 family protein [Myxococcota bacterium]
MTGLEALPRPVRRPRGGCRALTVLLLVLLAACAGSPGEVRYTTGRRAEVSPDGLHRIETWGGRAQRVYVRPGADLHGYDQVLLERVVLRFSLLSAGSLDYRTVALVEKEFHQIFEDELRKSQVYTLASTPGPRVLRVTPQLVDIVVAAPQAPRTPDEQVVVETSGAVTLAIELADSRSNATLMRAYDRRQVGGQTGLVYRQLPGEDVARAKIVFRQWSQRLRSWLDSVREIPPLPAEPPTES